MNFNQLLAKLQLESMCGLALYFIGFYVIFYFLDRRFKPTRNNYLKAVYLLGALVFCFLLFVFFRNLYNMKKIAAVKENFENDNEENDNTDSKKIELHYADWCGHCKSFKPKWSKLKKKLGNKYTFEEYNADNKDHKSIMKKRGVTGFPTLIMSSKGKTEKYNGERTVAAITKKLESL